MFYVHSNETWDHQYWYEWDIPSIKGEAFPMYLIILHRDICYRYLNSASVIYIYISSCVGDIYINVLIC